MVKISVIIPTLNEEKLLEKTLSQFTDEIKNKFRIEIIVTDGGSTDKTLSIAKKYSANVVENSSHLKQNISIGRNSGAKIAKGEILVFFNADTQIKNTEIFFSTLITTFQKKNVVGITCFVCVYQEEEIFADRIFHTFFNYYFWFLNVVGIGMGRGECHILSKKMFEELGGYNEEFAAGEDFDLFARLRKRGRIQFLKHTIIYESPRRYRKFGYRKILSLWFRNAISVLLFKKSHSKEWEVIR